MPFPSAKRQAVRHALCAAGAWLAATRLAVADTAEAGQAAQRTSVWDAAAVFCVAAVLWLLAWAAWRSWRRRQLRAAELRQVRVELGTLSGLLDVWQWRTDREHRLRWLRPPRAADDAAWRSLPAATPVWDCFRAEDGAALRRRFEAGGALDDVAVSFGGDEGTAYRAALCAAPLADAQGRFDGHLGTARAWPAAAAAARTAVASLPLPPAAEPTVGAAVGAPDTGIDARDSESLIYTVSHDLRAPIRVVEGFTKIVKEDYGPLLDRIGNDHLERVLGAAARMNNMIDAMLALSQLSVRPLARQPVNLSQLAAFVADDLRRQSPQREVGLHIEPGMLVHGDPTLLRVLLENLLGNAWKYTGKTRQPQVWFERDKPHPAATFCLRDNGAGFDMRFADRLFGAFQRLHSANDFQGTGVGLASVRRIVRRHGGEIWAESEVERGAAFYFSLPGR